MLFCPAALALWNPGPVSSVDAYRATARVAPTFQLQTAYTDGILWKVLKGFLQPLSPYKVGLKQEQKKDASNHHNPGDGG